MKKEEISIAPTYFDNYISLASDSHLLDALPHEGIDLFLNNKSLLEQIGMKTYAQGKWTVNQIVEHLIDTERIFQNRALRFARMDKTELPGYSEDDYAQSARSNQIPLKKLLSDYKIVRQSSVALFENFSNDELMRTGSAIGNEISVLAIGFVLIGHPVHHFKVIEERYAELI
jgi:hypothetical protein